MAGDATLDPRDPVPFVVEELRRTHAAYRSAAPDDLPGVLYHYTSGQGLLGILRSGEVHCTNVLYMNDASEMDYGRSIVLRVLTEENRAVPDSLRRYVDRIPAALEQPDFQYFVSCFCEKPDLLSQWRAYGAQAAGYAIGFGVDELSSVLPDFSELVQVVYDPDAQTELVLKTVRQYVAIARRCSETYAEHERLEDALIRWSNASAHGLTRVMARLKSQAFSEEHEWRVLITRFGFDTADVQLRLAASGIVVPYLAWQFRKQGVKAVRQVRHGPTVNSQLAIRSLGVLLQNLGYRDVSVAGSSIPLRF